MIAFVVNQTRGNIKKMMRGNFISILFRNIIHHIYFHILKNILFDYLLNLVFIVEKYFFKYSFSLKYSPQVFPLVFIDSSVDEVVILNQINQRGKYPPLWVTSPSLKVPLPNTPILILIFLVYPLHLTKLSHRNKTNRVSFMLQV